MRAALEQATDAELGEVMYLAAHIRAARAGFSDDPWVKSQKRRLDLIAVLHAINLRCLSATGWPLRTVADFNTHHRRGEPSYATYYREFGGLPAALAASGLTDVAQPEAGLSMPVGRPKGQLTFTLEDRVHQLAACIEDLAGLIPTEHKFANWREGRHAASTPSQNRICARGSAEQRSWDEMVDLAVKYILENPALFPRAYPRHSGIPRYQPKKPGRRGGNG